MRVVAIIPARGGSKGIPRKNLLPLHGKPLIAWTIEQALGSRLVTDVVVATDDAEIEQVARGYGVSVYRRSAASATDTARSEQVLREVVERVPVSWSAADYIVFLQATSPIRQPNDIDRCVRAAIDGQYASVFSARRIDGYTWQKVGTRVIACHATRPRRQDADIERIEENGSIYVFTPRTLLTRNSRHAEQPGVVFMHPLDSFQIDEPADVPLIESLMELRLRDCQLANAG